MRNPFFVTEHKLLFEPRDLWIGLYWKYNSMKPFGPAAILKLYICIIPMLPFYIEVYIWK